MVNPRLYVKVDSTYTIFGCFVLVIKCSLDRIQPPPMTQLWHIGRWPVSWLQKTFCHSKENMTWMRRLGVLMWVYIITHIYSSLCIGIQTYLSLSLYVIEVNRVTRFFKILPLLKRGDLFSLWQNFEPSLEKVVCNFVLIVTVVNKTKYWKH